jgi:hypothetical protein
LGRPQGTAPNGSSVRELVYDQQIGRMVLHPHNGHVLAIVEK